ncbi:MAG: DEAD/DEAH box helicase [Acidilobaceae archaeon]
MSEVERLLEELATRYGGRVAFKYSEESREPEPGPFVRELGIDERLAEVLESRGIKRFYKFQAEASKLIMEGRDVTIVAGTGTGKTEAFLIPILNKALKSDQRPTALLVYPTKALARDQLSRMKEYLRKLNLRAEVYDGDTPKNERERIVSDPPHLLLTNPDMLHYGLAWPTGLRDLVKGISYAVFDEIHLYGGVFGSHIRWVIQRLLRYAKDVVFVGSGATLGNPEDHGYKLFGRKPVVVEGPRRRKGLARHYFIDCGRASRWSLASALASELAKSEFKLKVLVFVDSQQMAEKLSRSISRRGVKSFVHRAGLPVDYRAMVEESMRKGDIDVVVATSTLELGIDIGILDVAIMVGLPSNYASYLQRAGRVGRRDKAGYIVTLMGEDPIETYFLRRPNEYFNQEIPPVFTEPANIEVAKLHLAAMLTEMGVLREKDIPDFAREALEYLISIGAARAEKGKIIGLRRELLNILKSSPGLRSTGFMVSIVDENEKKIGYRELPQALYELHPGAIYYHMGKPYVSESLDLDTLRAKVRRIPSDIQIYTKALYDVYAVRKSTEMKRRLGSISVHYGSVNVEIYIKGYMVKDESTGETISEQLFEKPLSWSYSTKGLFAVFPSLEMGYYEASSSFHALEHVLIAAGKPIAGYMDTDVGGVSYPTGFVVIFDSSPGGNGASRTLFERLDSAALLARRILSECTCKDGCPRCVYSPYCGNDNKMLSRRGALRLLEAVLEGTVTEVEAEPLGTPLA